MRSHHHHVKKDELSFEYILFLFLLTSQALHLMTSMPPMTSPSSLERSSVWLSACFSSLALWRTNSACKEKETYTVRISMECACCVTFWLNVLACSAPHLPEQLGAEPR